jgi:excisionase family DNA binding protein
MKASLVFDSKGARRRYLSITQVAEMLGVSRRTVQRWVYEHKLQAHQTFSNHIRIPEDEVDRMLRTTSIGKKI